MSGFQPKAEGFDSPAAHQDRGPFFVNVYRGKAGSWFGKPHHSRSSAISKSRGSLHLVYRLVITLKEKDMT